MQIQRIQTLYLVIAAIFTCVFCFFPYATVSVSEGETTAVLVYETPVLLIFNLMISILLIIDIFLYRNLKLQINIATLNIWLIVGSIITTLLYIYVGQADAMPAFNGGAILLLFALGFAIAARCGMNRDRKLLQSADRLR